MTGAVLLLGFVTLQRLGELLIARRNTARLLARGAVEIAPDHYPLIVLLHAAWLTVLWVLGWDREIVPFWLALYALLQVLRVWILASLGERWTTRVIVLPSAPLVRRGPYRWFSHPNYILICLEIAVLPLALGLPVVAVVFSALNALVLSIRIRAESVALSATAPADPFSP
jgi:methyltransferase